MHNRLRFGVIFLSIFYFACARSGPSPKEVLSKFLDSSLKYRFDEAYTCISSEDKSVKSQQEYSADVADKDAPIVKIFSNQITYEIKEVIIEGNKARADVNITMPNIGAMFGDLMSAALASAFSKDRGIDNVEKVIAEKYKGKEIPKTVVTKKYELTKESEGWKVYLGWKAEKLAKEAEEREKEAYKGKIVIKNLKVTSVDFLPTMISGEVKNDGDKALSEVKITIYYLDKDGKPIQEEEKTVVYESLSKKKGGFKPGYVETFAHMASGAPSEWRKKIQVKIADISFIK